MIPRCIGVILLSVLFFCSATSCVEAPDPMPSPMAPKIASFSTGIPAITSGETIDGEMVQGEISLAWSVSIADDVRLFANGEAIDTEECEPLYEDHACTYEGSLRLAPSQTTTYEIQALRRDMDCSVDDQDSPLHPEQCALERQTLEVFPPSSLLLEIDNEVVDYGSDVSIDYTVENAQDWEIGVLDFENGEGSLDPCVPASEDDGSAFCVLPEQGGAVQTSGTLEFENVMQGFSLVGFAENGADDDLGNFDFTDERAFVDVQVEGGPTINELVVEPADDEASEITPDSDIRIQWATENAESIDITADPSSAVSEVDLSSCSDIDASGAGSCIVQVQETDQNAQITFSAVAFDTLGQHSESATTTIDVDIPIEILEFAFESAGDSQLDAGDTTVLTWETLNAVGVELTVSGTLDDAPVLDPLIAQSELEACMDEGHDIMEESGSCTVTILSSVESGTEIIFSLVAEGIVSGFSEPSTLSTVIN